MTRNQSEYQDIYHISNLCCQAPVRLNSLDNRHLIKQIGPIVINSVPPSKPTRHIVSSLVHSHWSRASPVMLAPAVLCHEEPARSKAP